MKLLKIYSCLLILFLTACYNDDSSQTITEEIPGPVLIQKYEPKISNVNSSVIGFVVNELDEPVEDVEIKLGNAVTRTDAFGHFFINDKMMNELGTLVTAQKDGYFDGSRRFFPIQDAKNRIKIMLLEKNVDQSFMADEGGVITTQNGASVRFNGNTIRRADKTLYSGTVRVAMRWLDPTALVTLDQMPGNLQGVGLSTENQEVQLGTYGMLAVELFGENGELLNIADGETAELSMPVPTELQSGAPSEIPLWSYSEQYGIWVEESSAVLQNNNYVGDVSHFSFWNCDIPMDYVRLQMTVQDVDGEPLHFHRIRISAEGLGCGTGYTDREGRVAGFVPSDRLLTMEIYDYCDHLLQTENLGPFDEDTDIGIVTVDNPDVNSTRIAGSLLCNGEALSNGVVVAEFKDGDGSVIYTRYHYIEESADFDIALSACMDVETIDVQGFNVDDLTQSEVMDAVPGEDNDLGMIDLCAENLEEYIELTIDGVREVYLNPALFAGNDVTYIDAIDSFEYHITLSFNGQEVGDYTSNCRFRLYHESNNWTFDTDLNDPGRFVVSEYGLPGEAVIGEFEGVLPDSEGTARNVSGNFRVLRE